MNCPGCNKILASTLSVCPGCGTMMNDSVREELAQKISPLPKSGRLESKIEFSEEISKPISAPLVHNPIPKAPLVQQTYFQQTPIQQMPVQPKAVQSSVVQQPIVQQPVIQQSVIQPNPVAPTPVPPAPKIVEKIETSEIMAKPTSPTLVEFRNKNTTIPEWRLQLQNAVRKRSERGSEQTQAVSTQAVSPAPRPVLPTQGATALKAEPAIQEEPIKAKNPKLANAMRRIEQARQQFYTEEKPKLTAVPAPPQPAKNYPFTVVNPLSEEFSAPAEMPVGKFESMTFPIEKKQEKFDTNKLPPLSEIVEEKAITEVRPTNVAVLKTKSQVEAAEVTAYSETALETEEDFEEYDDCAPISMRFNAGLFDLLIGGFASFVLLSPFVIVNGNIFSVEGFFAFLATTAIVMFVYLTTSIAFFGRTLGMRLFSLEIIDVEENDYPTFHQAAVNSVVYLFSLALGGLGFLPALFNDERRAAHDLAAGTIVIREY